VNRQYSLRNSKYVVISDPVPTGLVTRGMCNEFLTFSMG